MIEEYDFDTDDERDFEEELEQVISGAELSVLLLLVSRISKAKADGIGKVLRDVSGDLAKVDAILESVSDVIGKASEKYLDRMAKRSDEWAQPFYEARGVAQSTKAESVALNSVVEGAKADNELTLRAVCNTKVAAILDADTGELLPLRSAYVRMVEDAARDIATGVKTHHDAVGEAVGKLAKSGLRVEYGNGRTMEMYGAVRMNVMDTMRSAMVDYREQQGREFGADGVEVSAHSDCAPDHLRYQGRQYTREEFEKINNGLARKIEKGANCVIEGTLVDASRATAIFKRHYSGEVIRIRTLFGNDLTVTSNHPILTTRGWVAANKLVNGDYVFSSGGSNGVPTSIRPYDDKRVARIEDHFSSASEKFGLRRFSCSPGDFHGDGVVNKHVDVVYINRELRDNNSAEIDKPIKKSLLHSTPEFSGFLNTECPFCELRMGPVRPPHCFMSSSGEVGALGCRHAGKPCAHCLASARCLRVPVFTENTRDNHLMYPERFADLSLRHSAFVKGDNSINVVGNRDFASIHTSVTQSLNYDLPRESCSPAYLSAVKTFMPELDEIINIDVFNWSGHVYNLSTDCEWYYANNIITHNCRHTVYPCIMGISSRAYNKKELRDVNRASAEKVTYTNLRGDEVKATRYESTQYQRSLERRMRKMDSQAALYRAAGDDESAAKMDAQRVQALDHYRAWCRDVGNPTMVERTKAYIFR